VNRLRIVLVVDDESVRGLLRTTFSGADHEILEATNGDDGLRLIEEQSPDVVILDWQTPGRHGSLVLDAVKTRRRTLPVIVLTADQRPSQRELAESIGADAFLNTPFSPAELLSVVERLLADRPRDDLA
jgi:two-component system, OmpR family, phosphate regulon response regulator PhoB